MSRGWAGNVRMYCFYLHSDYVLFCILHFVLYSVIIIHTCIASALQEFAYPTLPPTRLPTRLPSPCASCVHECTPMASSHARRWLRAVAAGRQSWKEGIERQGGMGDGGRDAARQWARGRCPGTCPLAVPVYGARSRGPSFRQQSRRSGEGRNGRGNGRGERAH